MKPQKQLYEHDPAAGIFGDCHRTAVAALFDLEPGQVPHFGDGGPPPDEFHRRCNGWLLSKGFRPVSVPFEGKECSLEQLLSAMAVNARGAHWLLGGKSGNGFDHTVLCKGGKIVCDPSKNDASIVAPFDDGYYVATFFVPIVYRDKVAA